MKILVVGPSWVGDMVMAQTLFIALKARDPDTQIDVLAPEWSRPILERMPQVAKALSMPIGHGSFELGMRRQLGRQLAAEKYDEAIVLPNSWKSALVPFFARIPQRTGWRGEMRYGLLNDIRLLDKKRYPLMIERFIALAHPPGKKLPDSLPRPELVVDAANVKACLQGYLLNLEKPVLALCPGAEFGEAKRWPTNHYATVAQHKINEGWQVWLFGSGKDHEVAERIKGQLAEAAQAHCHNLAGETSLADAVDLMSVADAVVSNDSGLMHIAAALARPLVVVYGSSSPDFTPPLNEQVRVLRTGIECSPCFKRECPLGHLKCLKDLPAQQVLDSLRQLLDETVTMTG
ncbi:MAG: lipopolysaccharide heptosyltransferase II [Pseudomonadales bacterium]